MIDLPAALKVTGPKRGGIAPAHLLDIVDVNGNLLFFSNRKVSAPPAITSAPPRGQVPQVDPDAGEFVAWIFPTAVSSANGSGSAVGNLSGGAVGYPNGGPFNDPAFVTWSGFSLGAVPANATITRAFYSAYVISTTPGPNPPALPEYPFDGQWWANRGDTARDHLEATEITFFCWDTTPGSHPNMAVSIDGPCLAVYYTLPGVSDTGGGTGNVLGRGLYKPWLLSVPEFTFHRSSVTDSGSFKLQNLSGDVLTRDMEKQIRASTLEGAMFVYRCWQPDAAASWLEVHGKLTIPDGGIGPDTLTLNASSLITPADADTPEFQYCETCQWRWGSRQCAAQGATECSYSYQSCQQLDRIFVVLNAFEKNYGDAVANVATRVVNRRRRV